MFIERLGLRPRLSRPAPSGHVRPAHLSGLSGIELRTGQVRRSMPENGRHAEPPALVVTLHFMD